MSGSFYRSKAWRELREAVLERDPICRTPGCGRPSVAADHIVQRTRGGADAVFNLRGLCIDCHNQRRQGGEPRAKGCGADGTPRDPGHWWNAEKSLGATFPDRPGDSPRESSTLRGRRH